MSSLYKNGRTKNNFNGLKVEGDAVITGNIQIATGSPFITLSNTSETESGLIFEDNQAPSSQSFSMLFDANKTDLRIASDSNMCMYFRENGNVGIGDSVSLPIKVLHIRSSTSGMLPPKMTTTERDAISNKSAGELLYNETTNKLQCYNGSTWNDCW